MSWFNYYGLIFIIIIMIPNIFYMVYHKENIKSFNNKKIEIFEQIGRFSSLFFMIFNIPFTYFPVFIDNYLVVYLIVNITFIVIYLVIFIIYFNKVTLFSSLALSIFPSLIFLFSGLFLINIPLIISSIIFGASHIYISVKNAK